MKYPDEGYIKFNIKWIKTPAFNNSSINSLIHWRDTIVKYGGIGYDNTMKVGIGNISIRSGSAFYISGSQTGHLKSSPNIFTKVTNCTLNINTLYCNGPVKASSESMTHYAAYKGNNKVKGIIHIHHAKLWHKYINTLPTTNFKTEYGTEEIANEVEAFSIKGHKIIIMAGHKDGILILGESLEDAGMAYLELIKNL